MNQQWHCPVCSNRIDATFGMIQCLHCQTVLFVDFSGNIIVGGTEEEPQEESLVDIELPQDSYSQIQSPEGEQAFTAVEPAEPVPLEEENYSFESEPQELEQPAPWDQGFSHAAPKTPSSADSALTMGDLGTILYRINIAGIDSSDLRKNILAALLDHRLGLVNDEVSESISDGQVTISGLNAIKASYIINSLKAQPIELKWEVYVESDSESKM